MKPTHDVATAHELGEMDRRIEYSIGRLLRIGVILAAVVTLAGAVLLLAHAGSTPVSFHAFHGVEPALLTVTGILRAAVTGNSRAIVELGLLLLIATPIARVAATMVAFIWQRDATYVVVSGIVLGMLLYGLLFGK